MTRLDVYLVKMESCKSRSIAKNLINSGLVSVNGEILKKSSYNVKNSDKILILTDYRNKPKGFWKLFHIENAFPFLDNHMGILDLGSSKGGFLEYCAIKCREVVGIEISKLFFDYLTILQEEYDNITLINENVFEFNLNLFNNKRFDCILNDLTLDPLISMKALIRFLPFLVPNGKLLFSIKIGSYDVMELRENIEQQFLYNNLIILKELNIDQELKEFHYILEKRD
ncbi:MAG: S4 domain-containing protein [Candidatus Helarchaeota archaeon]